MAVFLGNTELDMCYSLSQTFCPSLLLGVFNNIRLILHSYFVLLLKSLGELFVPDQSVPSATGAQFSSDLLHHPHSVYKIQPNPPSGLYLRRQGLVP